MTILHIIIQIASMVVLSEKWWNSITSFYVALCTGTPENKSMNIQCSLLRLYVVKKADGSWTWRPVVGDKADGAKYTFGVDH